jgi:molecular chaperone GrpE
MMKKPNLKDQLTRALADYDNLRKRVERERVETEIKANLRLILRLLPIMDALKSAQLHLKDSGLAITIGELENIFKDEGLEEIKVEKGASFDPGLHEAVEAVAGKEDGKVAEVTLSGWKFIEGPVIRYAKVKICQK